MTTPPPAAAPVEAPRPVAAVEVAERGEEGRGARGDHVADRAVGDQIAHGQHLGPVLRVLGDHEHGPGRARGREDAVARVEGGCERLLEQHVQPGGERFDRDRLVQVVRHRDERGVEVAVGERGGERRVRGARRCGRRRAARCGCVGIDRGGDGDRHAGPFDRVEVPVRDRAAADDRGAERARSCSSTATGNRSK